MKEYYCKGCGQLRLWAQAGEPVACGNCGSPEITVDELCSEKLTKLRFGSTPHPGAGGND